MSEIKLHKEDYATDVRKERRKGSGGTQEFFTPDELVNKMCDKISEADWADAEKDYLEPCLGNGNFVLAIIQRKIQHGSTWEQALKHTWGVELMPDNLAECYDRVISLLGQMGVSFDEKKARKIMKHNLVCSDFFKWDFENWKPIDEPIKVKKSKPEPRKQPECIQLELF